jgi:hypothetical protein
MIRYCKIFIFLTFLSLSSYSQTSHLKIYLQDKLTKEAISNKEITVIINDTLMKIIKTDIDGILKPILINGGRYKIEVRAEGYVTGIFKKVGVDGARGRNFMVGLKPVKKAN